VVVAPLEYAIDAAQVFVLVCGIRTARELVR